MKTVSISHGINPLQAMLHHLHGKNRTQHGPAMTVEVAEGQGRETEVRVAVEAVEMAAVAEVSQAGSGAISDPATTKTRAEPNSNPDAQISIPFSVQPYDQDGTRSMLRMLLHTELWLYI